MVRPLNTCMHSSKAGPKKSLIDVLMDHALYTCTLSNRLYNSYILPGGLSILSIVGLYAMCLQCVHTREISIDEAKLALYLKFCRSSPIPPMMTDNQAYGTNMTYDTAYGPMATYNQAYAPIATYSEPYGPIATYSEPYMVPLQPTVNHIVPLQPTVKHMVPLQPTVNHMFPLILNMQL